MAQRLLHRLFFGNFFWQSQWHSDLLHRLLLAISFDNPNGTATVTQTSFGNLFWQSQWHSGLLHRLLLAISFDNPNGTATVTQTSFGNLFWQSQWHSDCYTDFFWQFLLTIPMAQRLLHRLLLEIFFDNPNGTATVTQTSFGNFFWQSQWHSDCYTDFFLAISFDNPNGTATVTQTSFGNLFWQSQWHSDCYTDFFWQSAELRFFLSSVWQRPPQRPNMATETRFRWRRLGAGISHATLSPHFFLLSFQVQKPSNS